MVNLKAILISMVLILGGGILFLTGILPQGNTEYFIAGTPIAFGGVILGLSIKEEITG